MKIVEGLSLLGLVLVAFSLFSFKAPKGQAAMSGLAGAAVATFLVEAIHKYIFGDFAGISFLGSVGSASGTMGGVAAALLVCINMGVNPVFATAIAASVAGFGILPGFIAGYLLALVAPKLEAKFPKGTEIIFGVLILTPIARLIATLSAPYVDGALTTIGSTIAFAADQSPILMGFLLGGIIKVVCTSPLSSMALTAMLNLQGLAMGIASIACVGGSFTNGLVFHRLKLGDKSKVIGVMLEPLTQADVVSMHAVPIYMSNFLGGGIAGIGASYFNIINNAPGTASPIPGLIAPFAFNNPITVVYAIIFAVVGGVAGGFIGTAFYKLIRPFFNRKRLRQCFAFKYQPKFRS